MHNTFGEFLVADFLLRRTVEEVESLALMEQNERLHFQLEQRFASPDGFSRTWLACLIYTPLYTRPVVLDMIREWVRHCLTRKQISKKDFVKYLDQIVLNQIRRLVTEREMPSILRKETASDGLRVPFGAHPLLGHVAIYSMNLIILRAMVDNAPFIFDESTIASHEDGTRPWDQLTHIWRSWFSIDNLNGVTAVLTAERDGCKISLTPKETFRVGQSSNRLQTFFNISSTLSDNISTALAGLLLHDPGSDDPLPVEKIAELLNAEHIELKWQTSLFQLFKLENLIDESDQLFFKVAERTLHLAFQLGRFEEFPSVLGSVRRGLQKRLLDYRSSAHPAQEGRAMHTERMIVDLFDPRFIVELATRSPEAALSCVQLVREFFGERWFSHYRGRDLMERVLYPPRLMEFAEREPAIVLTYLQLAREVGGETWVRRYAEEFLSRSLSPKQLVSLLTREPRLALGWIDLLATLQTSDIGTYVEETLQRVLRSSFVLNLAENDPRAFVDIFRRVRIVSPRSLNFSPHFLDRLSDPERLSELARWQPQAALASLELLRVLGGEENLGKFRRNLLRVFNPLEFLEHGRWTPEELLQCAAIIGEPLEREWLDLTDGRALKVLFATELLVRLVLRRSEAFTGAIFIAKVARSDKAVRAIAEALKILVVDGYRDALGALPLDVVPDLYRIANFDSSGGVTACLDALLSRRKSAGE